MAKLSSFNRECIPIGFEEEFWPLKHLNSPSEAVEESKLRDKDVSSTENMLAAALCRIWYRDWRGSGGTIYMARKRSLNMGGG